MNYFRNAFKVLILGLIFLCQCTKKEQSNQSLSSLALGSEHITGKKAYLNSPFITAGDRVYMVGNQSGDFPDMGWHVAGEMGGIWDHPVKLLDGFLAAIKVDGKAVALANAETFINYPFANKHIFKTGVPGLEAERFQFVPDGREAVVVEYTFTNNSDKIKKVTVDLNAFTDLRPVWLGERTNMIDARDDAYWEENSKAWIAKDSLNEWYVMFGSELAPEQHRDDMKDQHFRPKGKGCQASLTYDLEIQPNRSKSIPIIIAGSYKSKSQVIGTFEFVKAHAAHLLKAKKERFVSLASKTKLTVRDKNFQQAFEWVKYNTDWLVRDVPETGRGVSAGAPDYPWWFGVDSEYTLRGLITTGRKDLVYQSIDNIVRLSEKANGNGRIVHEVSTNGAVFNPGNVNETPQFATLIWSVYGWTGDRKFLEKYYPVVTKGLDWLLKEKDKDGNLLPDGFGMMEIHGLNSEMIDVAVYTQSAFADAASMAQEIGDPDRFKKYKDIADQIKIRINRDFWVADSHSYADFIGTVSQAIHLLDDAVIRADTLGKPWAVSEMQSTKAKLLKLPRQRKQGFVVHHNWVVNTPMEMGIADSSKALIALSTAEKFVNPFGAFVTGIDRDESAGQDESSAALNKKVFNYTGAVMTLPTGVLAIAENNYGRPDEAFAYLKRMTKSFSFALPGSIYEVSPDYGMMAQAWNIYSFAIPVVQQFFGIMPHASAKMVTIRPQMPTSWHDAKLEHVEVGDNELGITYRNKNGMVQINLAQTIGTWKMIVSFPKGKFKSWALNGQPVKPQSDGQFDILQVTGKSAALTLK